MPKKSKSPIPASDLLKQLKSDPTWVAQHEAQENARLERTRKLAQDEASLVREIRRLGYDIDSVSDLIHNAPHPSLDRKFIGPYKRVYPVLIRHLKLPHRSGIREAIIRALTVKDGGSEVESAFFTEFKIETDPEMRWVLANALRTAMPYHRRRKHPEINQVLKGND